MISREVVITNAIGLHARPATFFIQKANTYKSTAWVEKGDRRVNAKSLLGVLSLGVAQGMTIRLIAEGSDEVEALDGLEQLLNNLEAMLEHGFAE
ncbi:MAG: HPr family phosphocarrier protein [Clostridia bacterium]|jgi:phosphocarrier protein|nr:HPr family phosphocarrier protein [Clostridia bacterium]